MFKQMGDMLYGAVVPVLLLVLWQALSSYGIVDPKILPSPLAVLVKWLEYLMPSEPFDAAKSGYLAWLFSGELIGDATASLYRVGTGFIIGSVLALPFGLLMGANDAIYRLFNPLFQVLRPIPPIAFIPLSILWFGLGNPPAIFLIIIGAFFPVLMNTIAGVRQARRRAPTGCSARILPGRRQARSFATLPTPKRKASPATTRIGSARRARRRFLATTTATSTTTAALPTMPSTCSPAVVGMRAAPDRLIRWPTATSLCPA